MKDINMLRLFDNRGLRICGPKRDAVRGQWRRLQDGEFYDLY
jgi:hypothetical protein